MHYASEILEKLAYSLPMVTKLEHCTSSCCPMACALDIIGDHWTLLVIRDLMFLGRHEYKDMLAGEEGISSNILSGRLKKLEGAGIITFVQHPESKRRKLYYLTQKGKDLVYIMLDVARWADKHLDDKVVIPEDRRFFLDMPAETVANTVFDKLAAWEKEFIGGSL